MVRCWQRARLWEIQSLTRTRPIAGNLELGRRFQELASTLTNFSQTAPPVAAYSPDWLKEIARMRERIERERTPPGKDRLAIKTGAGGLVDAEFIAQAQCLARGWNEPNTLKALERARDSQTLPPADAERLIDNYRQLRRIEGILRRWSFAGETVLPADKSEVEIALTAAADAAVGAANTIVVNGAAVANAKLAPWVFSRIKNIL